MLNLEIEIDYKEVDEAIGRLMGALNTERLHAIGSITAFKQVKTKYAERFSKQVNYNSKWQQSKRQVEGDLPLGGRPGFLTGTTFNSISVDYDDKRGGVYLKGSWPKGSGRAALYRVTEGDAESSFKKTIADICFKWGEGFGLDFKLPETSVYHKNPEEMINKKYGPDGDVFLKRTGKALNIEEGKKSREIKFMYLDDEDIDIVISNLQKYIENTMEGNDAGVKGVFESLKLPKKEDMLGVDIPGADIYQEAGKGQYETLESSTQSDIIYDSLKSLQQSFSGGLISEETYSIEKQALEEFLKNLKF